MKMKIKLSKIGNSKGIILSKTILKNYGITDKIELILEKTHLVLKPVKSEENEKES
jgi:antitoxin MazE